MRKFIIVGLIALGALAQPSAQAARPFNTAPHAKVTHRAPIPCHFVCPYWTDGPGGNRQGDFCPAEEPVGTFDKTLFRIQNTPAGVAPQNTDAIDVWSKSDIDYDSWVCTDTNPPRLIVSMANILADECEGFFGQESLVPVGCEEHGVFTVGELRQVSANPSATRFWVVTYNWLDTSSITLELWGSNANGNPKNIIGIVDDSYVAGCPDPAAKPVCDQLPK